MADLPYERLIIATTAVATMEGALEQTLAYVKERRAFGKPIAEFQHTRFRLAELATETRIARVFIDDCIRRQLEGTLDTATASMAKYWCTDLQQKVTDGCLQMFGGYGYMTEYPISRMFADARVQRIYAGTNEIQRNVIAERLLGLPRGDR
jgi:acyl-CoA dehydrogenase